MDSCHREQTCGFVQRLGNTGLRNDRNVAVVRQELLVGVETQTYSENCINAATLAKAHVIASEHVAMEENFVLCKMFAHNDMPLRVLLSRNELIHQFTYSLSLM